MDALVMAGGKGARLGKDEKPLTNLCGKPLIQYVLEALLVHLTSIEFMSPHHNG